MSTTEWTVLEKLLLSQAVYKYGEDNWHEIAKKLKQHALLHRPSDYFNQKNCSLQYYLMVEDMNQEKRPSVSQDMPAVVQLARKLYSMRIDELKKQIGEDEEEFLALLSEIEDIHAGKWDDRLLKEQPYDETKDKEEHAMDNLDYTVNDDLESPVTETESKKSVKDEDIDSITSEEDIPSKDAESVDSIQTKTSTDSIQTKVSTNNRDDSMTDSEGLSNDMSIPPIELTEERERQVVNERKDMPEDMKKEENSHVEKVDILSDMQTPADNREETQATDSIISSEIIKVKIEKDSGGDTAWGSDMAASDNLADINKKRDIADSPTSDTSEPKRLKLEASATEKECNDASKSDLFKVDYSTDVSQATTPADGTESVAGSESNVTTPSHDRKKSAYKDDPKYKSWLKNINLLWHEVANHKNGTMFMNPIKESIAPFYYDIIKQPMDLKKIKNRIRDGIITTTVEFERDVMLMLCNALIYNKEDTEVYQMAREMLDDVTEQIRIFKTIDTETSTSSHTRAAALAAKEGRRSVEGL
ncbi:hypothetical protein BDB01DRAFT_787469 [Pilobolus umbonatus]|nr:hypothetical protein BDB01DRAFT_787469 [Pilobolus umbonatus]